MKIVNIDTPNTRKVLEIYLQNPAKSLDYIDIRKMLNNISANPIREALRALKQHKILEVSHVRGRLHSGIGVERYKISSDLNEFKELSDLYRKDGIYEFIKSEYISGIKKKFSNLLLEKAAQHGPKSVADFIELDIHLSPITAIQSDFPPKLLLYQHFDRIFSDVYLLDKNDITILVKRAYVLYSNFAEIFSSTFTHIITERNDNRDHLKDIASIVKQAIFYWNISSHNFDWAYSCLMDAVKSGDEIEFYIGFVDGVIKIYKLKSKPGSLPLYLSNDTLISNYFMSEPIQFDYLRACIPFERDGVAVEPITYDEILKEVKYRLGTP
jgi:hypothetical protein